MGHRNLGDKSWCGLPWSLSGWGGNKKKKQKNKIEGGKNLKTKIKHSTNHMKRKHKGKGGGETPNTPDEGRDC